MAPSLHSRIEGDYDLSWPVKYQRINRMRSTGWNRLHIILIRVFGRKQHFGFRFYVNHGWTFLIQPVFICNFLRVSLSVCLPGSFLILLRRMGFKCNLCLYLLVGMSVWWSVCWPNVSPSIAAAAAAAPMTATVAVAVASSSSLGLVFFGLVWFHLICVSCENQQHRTFASATKIQTE